MDNRIIIPVNFAAGGIAFGTIKWRNLIEGAVISISVAYPLYKYMPLDITGKIYATIMFVAPLLFFAVCGISGLSLSAYLYYSIKFMMNRRLLTYPDSKAKIQREKNLLKKKKQQLQIQRKEEHLEKKENKRKGYSYKFKKGNKKDA